MFKYPQERSGSLLGEGAVEQPGDDGQVLALVVRRQNHRVLVGRRSLCHCSPRLQIRGNKISKRVENFKRMPPKFVVAKDRVQGGRSDQSWA